MAPRLEFGLIQAQKFPTFFLEAGIVALININKPVSRVTELYFAWRINLGYQNENNSVDDIWFRTLNCTDTVRNRKFTGR